ncbi:MAG: class I SAM-dependent methyltransferase [Desulfarculaceae bacterium]|nr:class I SAM-dependent methyltransferase [Desulfarculaceae bacterium]MCF8072879.1 class I SAM-dependent methyltransferase [Desulfarculaceae bacterium]MCF8101047.1 class I SAM-dependent methyltransferase [Desulfarculaceae bacterium]MCF8115566.1 class I SAM-dependent methyltransferase [Desulfarculaceae bacterium]
METPGPARLAHPAPAGFQALEDLASAGWFSEVLFAALELDIFARLGRESRTAEELAKAQSWDAPALERLLAALADLGLLASRQGRYANGPVALRHLLPGEPDYLGHFLAYRRYIAGHWKRLPARVRQGTAANQRDHDEPPEMYRQRVLAYVRALDAQARLKAAEALERLGALPAPPGRILDLGGGAGAWCRALLARWPRARGVLLDLPEVLDAARELYPGPSDWARIEAVEGDCREPQLAARSFDLIVLSNLLHVYSPREAEGIVARAAALLAPDGCLLIHDYLCEEQAGAPLKGRLYDLHMLLNTFNGCIHPLESLAVMLAAAGLGDWRLAPLPSDSALILARADRQ